MTRLVGLAWQLGISAALAAPFVAVMFKATS